MLELIFQGFLEWIYGLILECWQYFSSALLDLLGMDFAYLEDSIPVIPAIRQSMLAAGWALLIGNLVFQAVRSMMTGLGFEADDPKLLFTRTFVFSFLLVASPQICGLCLNMTSNVIALVELPHAVSMTLASESAFRGLSSAWILVILCGLIVMFQSFRLFFEMAERYFILAVLTITAPLAFGMGGSRSTSGIFSGWCKMYGSICLLMVLNVMFVKMLLSVMSYVPVGLDVLPWIVLVIAVVKVAHRADNIITRIGLNPPMADNSRLLPGMLTYMVARTAISNTARVISENGTGGHRNGARSGGPGRSGGPRGESPGGGQRPGGPHPNGTQNGRAYPNGTQDGRNHPNGAQNGGTQTGDRRTGGGQRSAEGPANANGGREAGGRQSADSRRSTRQGIQRSAAAQQNGTRTANQQSDSRQDNFRQGGPQTTAPAPSNGPRDIPQNPAPTPPNGPQENASRQDTFQRSGPWNPAPPVPGNGQRNSNQQDTFQRNSARNPAPTVPDGQRNSGQQDSFQGNGVQTASPAMGTVQKSAYFGNGTQAGAGGGTAYGSASQAPYQPRTQTYTQQQDSQNQTTAQSDAQFRQMDAVSNEYSAEKPDLPSSVKDPADTRFTNRPRERLPRTGQHTRRGPGADRNIHTSANPAAQQTGSPSRPLTAPHTESRAEIHTGGTHTESRTGVTSATTRADTRTDTNSPATHTESRTSVTSATTRAATRTDTNSQATHRESQTSPALSTAQAGTRTSSTPTGFHAIPGMDPSHPTDTDPRYRTGADPTSAARYSQSAQPKSPAQAASNHPGSPAQGTLNHPGTPAQAVQNHPVSSVQAAPNHTAQTAQGAVLRSDSVTRTASETQTTQRASDTAFHSGVVSGKSGNTGIMTGNTNMISGNTASAAGNTNVISGSTTAITTGSTTGSTSSVPEEAHAASKPILPSMTAAAGLHAQIMRAPERNPAETAGSTKESDVTRISTRENSARSSVEKRLGTPPTTMPTAMPTAAAPPTSTLPATAPVVSTLPPTAPSTPTPPPTAPPTSTLPLTAPAPITTSADTSPGSGQETAVSRVSPAGGPTGSATVGRHHQPDSSGSDQTIHTDTRYTQRTQPGAADPSHTSTHTEQQETVSNSSRNSAVQTGTLLHGRAEIQTSSGTVPDSSASPVSVQKTETSRESTRFTQRPVTPGIASAGERGTPSTERAIAVKGKDRAVSENHFTGSIQRNGTAVPQGVNPVQTAGSMQSAHTSQMNTADSRNHGSVNFSGNPMSAGSVPAAVDRSPAGVRSSPTGVRPGSTGVGGDSTAVHADPAKTGSGSTGVTASSANVKGNPGVSTGIPGKPGTSAESHIRETRYSSVPETVRGVSSGTQGLPGTAGTHGTQGLPGTVGTHGTQGSPGTAGIRGTQGLPGTAGTHGTQGSPGTAGTHGAQGSPGTTGTHGTQGAPGTTGTHGTQGPPGQNGVPGQNGMPGEHGQSNNRSTGPVHPGGTVFSERPESIRPERPVPAQARPISASHLQSREGDRYTAVTRRPYPGAEHAAHSSARPIRPGAEANPSGAGNISSAQTPVPGRTEDTPHKQRSVPGRDMGAPNARSVPGGSVPHEQNPIPGSGDSPPGPRPRTPGAEAKPHQSPKDQSPILGLFGIPSGHRTARKRGKPPEREGRS